MKIFRSIRTIRKGNGPGRKEISKIPSSLSDACRSTRAISILGLAKYPSTAYSMKRSSHILDERIQFLNSIVLPI